jgi:hypothetical protein
MIYEDQPQMVEAATQGVDPEYHFIAQAGLTRAFAAIDREALIEKAAHGFDPQGGNQIAARMAERALVAAGIIPASAALPRKERRDA